MTTRYTEQRLQISDNQKEKIKLAMKNNESVTIRVEDIGNDLIALTNTQINKIDKAFQANKSVNIKLSKQQLKYNKDHVMGGFIGVLAGLARMALPTIAKSLGVGAVTGLASNLVNKALGNGFYLKRGGYIAKVKDQGNGLYLKPYQSQELERYGDGLYIKQNGQMYEGSGLIHDLAKDIPILNLLF